MCRQQGGATTAQLVGFGVVLALFLAPLSFAGSSAGGSDPLSTTTDGAAEQLANDAYQRLPLRFDANRGQLDAAVDFVSRGPGYTLFLSATESVLRLAASKASPAGGAVVRMRLSGADTTSPAEGSRRLAGVSNYLVGTEEDKWVRDVPGFAKVTYRGVYPGIDMVYYGDSRQRVEYDFEVAPGVDPSVIALSFEGHRGLSLNDEGDLVVATTSGDLVQHRPVVYQPVDGGRDAVTSSYRLDGGQVRFDLGPYDRALPLVIDPVLEYSSYLGGSSPDEANAIAVSREGGFAYVTGTTHSTDFPSASPFAPDNTGGADVFVAKLATSASGVASLVYATYLGGKQHPDGPPRPCRRTAGHCNPDAEIPPLNATYVYRNGTGGDDSGLGIAVDRAGIAYITGSTTSHDFPTTTNAYDRHCGTRADKKCDFSSHDSEIYMASDAFVTALGPSGSTVVYSSYLGGSGDRPNTTEDGFMFEGARRPSGVDSARAIVTDGAGAVYITGSTTSPDFPVTNGTRLHPSSACLAPGSPNPSRCPVSNPFPDAFLAKIDTTVNEADRLGSLVFGTYYDPNDNLAGWRDSDGQGAVIDAGSGEEIGAGIALGVAPDPPGTVYVAGSIGTRWAPDRATGEGRSGEGAPDVFVWKVDTKEARTSGEAFFGGSRSGRSAPAQGRQTGADRAAAVAVGPGGLVYVVGQTNSHDMPTTPSDVFQPSRQGEEDADNGFVASFHPTLALRYATYLGAGRDDVGLGGDGATGVGVDAAGNAYVSGFTPSRAFPVKDSSQPASAGISESAPDAFVAKLNSTGTALEWSTYLGGGGTAGTLANGEDRARGIAVDDEGNAYVAGVTIANDFPVVEPFQHERGGSSDAFVAKISATSGARPSIRSIEPRAGPPGTPVTITGAGFVDGVSLHFGDVAVSPSDFSRVSNTTITAVSPVPDEPGKAVLVSVRNAQGASRSAAHYTNQQGSWARAPSPPAARTGLTPASVVPPTPQSQARWGERLAMAGDLNGDGYKDFFVSAPKEDLGGTDGTDAGRVYAMSGKDHKKLYAVDGERQAMGNFGVSVSVPGDLNGDGTTDVVIGADGIDASALGPDGRPVGPGCGFAEPNGCYEDQGGASAFEGKNGLLLYRLANPHPQGAPGNPAHFGASVGRAGDVNADGVADVIVGAPDNDATGGVDQGQAFIFNGSNGALLQALDLPAGGQACVSKCAFGASVQGPGDVDGDGITDQLVAASNVGSGAGCGTGEPNGCNEGQGRMYLFSGQTGQVLRSIDNPQPQVGAAFGLQDAAPLSPGDVNGDGFDDIYGAASKQNGAAGASVGRAWVFSGQTGELLYALDDPTPTAHGQFGASVSETDHNGDATPDLYVGSSPLNVSAVGGQGGGTYVFSGVNGALLESLELPDSERPDKTGGSGFGSAVAAGDLNGDGQVDYLASAPSYDHERPPSTSTSDVGSAHEINHGKVFVFTSRLAGLAGATFTVLDGPACHGGGPSPPYCGNVLVVGGSPNGSAPSAFSRLYDPKHGSWSAVNCEGPAPDCPAELNESRSRHSATLLANGRVLVVSGATSEVYDPPSGQWSRTGDPVHPKVEGHTATLLQGPECHGHTPPHHCGKVLFVGGSTAELFDPDDPVDAVPSVEPAVPVRQGRWAPTDAPSVPRAFGHAATLLVGPGCGSHCGKVLVTGGRSNTDGTTSGSAELYDPRSGTWASAGNMAVTRANHTATSLGDGRVLIAGGRAGGPSNPPQSSAEIYDPAPSDPTKTWRMTARMPGVRYSHTGVRVPGGQVLILRGHDGEAEVATALLYEPRARGGFGGWQAAGAVRGESSAPAVLLWSEVTGADPAICGVRCGGVLAGSQEPTSQLAAGMDLYTPPPWVSSLSATRGPREGGVSVTIAGAGFAPGTQVLFGRTPATSRLVSYGEMNAKSPAMPAGITPVRVVRNLVGVGDAPQPFVTGGPAAVTDLDAQAISTTKIKLSFSASGAGGGMGAPARSYLVKQSTSPIDASNFDAAKSLCDRGVCGGFEPGAVGTNLSLEVGGLLPDTAYHYAIKALDEAGTLGEISNPASAITHGVAPGAVSEASATALSSSEIRLEFAAAGSNATGPPPAAQYLIKRSTSPIDDAARFDDATPVCAEAICRFAPGAVGDPLELVVGGLSARSTYHFALRARDEAGQLGPISAAVSATTLRAGCVSRLPKPLAGQVAYPGGYSMASLPAGTNPRAHSRLFSWFDQGAGGAYSERAGDAPAESGRAYWAFGWCPRLVELSGAGTSSASFALAGYRASMVGNPSGLAPATITGHDFTARWDPRLNGGAGGYHVSGYRQAQDLAVGEGIWAFSYVPTTLTIAQR